MTRKIEKIIKGQMTSDGAGVRLMRIFGFYEEGMFDPFLLLDFFGSDNPEDYLAGFPWHPHRGMETVTYMLEGRVEHGDSMGNKGIIGKGDVQWMNAGSGIIHQEMPQSDTDKMYGFQLWVNLPAIHKMIKPAYQEIKAKNIPEITLENKVKVKIIAGESHGINGPVNDITINPIYIDVSVPENTVFSTDVNPDYTVFAFIYEGEAYFDDNRKEPVSKGECILFGSGSKVSVKTKNSSGKFILISGKPIKEPVAWRGPIVMNTDEELNLAFKEYREGTFVK